MTGPLEARLQALAPLAIRTLQEIAREGAPRDQARARRALRAYGLEDRDQDRVQDSGEGSRAGEGGRGGMCGSGDA